jgi:hypothetical protein
MNTDTNTQHTPGPWEHDRMFLGNSKDRRSGFVVNGPKQDPLPLRVCDIRCSPDAPLAISEANARLIASAPELLAALQEALEFINSAAPRFPKSIKHPDCFKLNLVRAAVYKAIHKATGN